MISTFNFYELTDTCSILCSLLGTDCSFMRENYLKDYQIITVTVLHTKYVETQVENNISPFASIYNFPEIYKHLSINKTS